MIVESLSTFRQMQGDHKKFTLCLGELYNVRKLDLWEYDWELLRLFSEMSNIELVGDDKKLTLSTSCGNHA